MKVLTREQMREADGAAVKIGISAAVLMENAARAVVAEIVKLAPKKVRVFAGGGQNGGDGFAVARHLLNLKIGVEIIRLFDEAALVGAAKTNFAVAKALGISFVSLSEIRGGCDVVVDAIYGVGFRGEAKGEEAKAIKAINEGGAPVISIDLPSGVCPDSGNAKGAAVRAFKTVALGYLKPAHVLWPGAGLSGEVIVADISLPPYEGGHIRTIEAEDAGEAFPPLAGDSHKGNLGHALIIAGSAGMSGAAYLATQAAVRGGAGLVTAAVPSEIMPIMGARLTGAMCAPLSKKLLGERAGAAQSVCIGPGLGDTEETAEYLKAALEYAKGTVVIDADGLNALSRNMGLLENCGGRVILTPHPGEMGRLLGKSADEVLKNRLSFAKELADKYNVIVVLKGAGTVVAAKGAPLYVNTTGCAAMARGGSGDILAGFIAGIAARGVSPLICARTGVYLHGIAGEIAGGGGDYALTAEGLLAALSPAIAKL